MVRALLDGRKTQTRREVKRMWGSDHAQAWSLRDGKFQCADNDGWHDCEPPTYPYGKPGDLLWVRETTYDRPFNEWATKIRCGAYSADDEPVLDPAGFDLSWWYSRPICPGIHMPRWASRLTLRLTDVRVQRIADITDADCEAEGWPGFNNQSLDNASWFREVWHQIHGTNPWIRNSPDNVWVFALTFEVIRKNVDEVLSAP